MLGIIEQNFTYFLVAMLFIGRLGDILSTYLVTPKLKLEANFIVRKFRWPFAILTLLICLIPLYSRTIGVVFIVLTYLVCFHNFCQVGLANFFGEDDFIKVLYATIRKNGLKKTLLFMYIAHLFMISIGLLLLFLTNKTEWGYWIGHGIILFSIVVLVHKTIFFVKISKDSRDKQYNITIDEV